MSYLWEPSVLTRLEVDEIWKAAGRYGRYQMVQILTLSVVASFVAFPVLSGVFVGANNPHHCQPHDSFLKENHIGENVTSYSCSVSGYSNRSDDEKFVTSDCESYQYEKPAAVSFVSEWDLVCDNAALAQLSQTLVMAGMFFGAMILANLADRFGRKRAQVGCHLLLFGASLAMAFMPTYASFNVTKFFAGVFQHGTVIPMFIHMMELLPKQQRSAMGVLACAMWAVSVMAISPIAYAMRSYSWRTMQIVFASFHAFAFLEIFILDESLRWLLANNCFAAVRRGIRKAAKYNHREADVILSCALTYSDAVCKTKRADDHLTTANMELIIPVAPDAGNKPETTAAEMAAAGGKENGEELNGSSEDRQGLAGKEEEGDAGKAEDADVSRHHDGLMDLIKDPDMRFFSLSLVCIWMTNSMTYYGVTLLSSSLAGNPYINFFLGGLLELPSNGVMWFLLGRVGRKKTNIAFISLAAVSLLAASLVAALGGGSETAGIMQTVLSMVARFAITGSFNAIWVYTPELFPTNLRNISVGICSSGARLGSMAAPFYSLLASKAVWAPGAIFSGACLIVTVLLTFLPETTHRSLPQTISDVKAWRRQDRNEKAAK